MYVSNYTNRYFILNIVLFCSKTASINQQTEYQHLLPIYRSCESTIILLLQSKKKMLFPKGLRCMAETENNVGRYIPNGFIQIEFHRLRVKSLSPLQKSPG